MREILFRGKRLDNGEWVEGSYVFQYGCHEIYLPTLEGEYGFDRHPVAPSTVGQYTGLQDKNGKRIFEGDVVRVHDTLKRCDEPGHKFGGYVTYRDGSFVICEEGVTHYRWMDYEVEVIANIHEGGTGTWIG